MKMFQVKCIVCGKEELMKLTQLHDFQHHCVKGEKVGFVGAWCSGDGKLSRRVKGEDG